MRRPPSATRNDFRRDCDRIIHCTAFRRLAHKAQVFVSRISKIAFVRRAFDSCRGDAIERHKAVGHKRPLEWLIRGV
jgi:hypothetical protein